MSKKSFDFNYLFGCFAALVSRWAGHPYTFCSAVLLLLIWAGFGPAMHYSDAWQLMINTGTTIVTFLMVFVIQNSQNRDGLAAQIKLDEIIRAIHGARNDIIDLESMTDEQIAELHRKFAEIAKRARKVETAEG